MSINETICGGLRRVSQPDGPALAWYEDSGIGLIEQDGLYFKDMARTGALLPYEDWRLPAGERARDLAARRRLRLENNEVGGLRGSRKQPLRKPPTDYFKSHCSGDYSAPSP